MNSYEERQEARRERYLERAEKARAESSEGWRRVREMSDAIPFGQPIHVGHHSEKGDRAYRARIEKTSEKAFRLNEKADYYEQKAASVGTGGISSDDPDAIEKLKKDAERLKVKQERNPWRKYREMRSMWEGVCLCGGAAEILPILRKRGVESIRSRAGDRILSRPQHGREAN